MCFCEHTCKENKLYTYVITVMKQSSDLLLGTFTARNQRTYAHQVREWKQYDNRTIVQI